MLDNCPYPLRLCICGGRFRSRPERAFELRGEFNPGQCDPSSGKLVINVTQQVTGDIDSGCAGNYWAYDEYNKHMQVWQVAPNSFCVDVRYLGSFTTVAGPSPGTGCAGGAIITADIEGTFEGGYKASVTGTLKAAPSKRTKGNIGQIDYAYDASTGVCANQISWLTYYFNPGYNFQYHWWGWVYHGGNNGSWVNAVTGNQGDITP